MKKLLVLLLFAACAMNAMDDDKKNKKLCCGLFAYFKKCSAKKPEQKIIFAKNMEEFIRISNDSAFKNDVVIMDFLAHLKTIPHEPVPGTICETAYSRDE